MGVVHTWISSPSSPGWSSERCTRLYGTSGLSQFVPVAGREGGRDAPGDLEELVKLFKIWPSIHGTLNNSDQASHWGSLL